MSKGSVVTGERFEQALSYADYLAGVAVNRDQFEHYYRTVQLTDADVAFFKDAVKRPSGPAKLLAIAEAWCPDVFRGLPVFARIAEASNMTLKVVLRDENPDIMDEFLLNGTARAIPVAIFYTRDHRYITHWIERPAVAHVEIARVKAEFNASHPSVDLKTATPAERQALISFFDANLPQHYPAWQVETIREIRELLASAQEPAVDRPAAVPAR